ncbi:MAG: hypothetical protein AB8B87_11645 [Granulosicoccus sp.]
MTDKPVCRQESFAILDSTSVFNRSVPSPRLAKARLQGLNKELFYQADGAPVLLILTSESMHHPCHSVPVAAQHQRSVDY